MKKNLFAAMLLVAASGTALPLLAADAELCLDCHEPAEDWEGKSADELLAEAKDSSNKRHKKEGVLDMSDEELKVIIAELMPE
jgi:hypothetical protein